MTRKKKIYKKKGKVIKDLTRNIFKVLNEDSNKKYNYKQIAAKMGISDTDGKTQIIQKLAELTSQKKIKEVDRGKFQINEDRKYHVGTLDVTSNGNAYFICDDFEHDIFIPSVNLGKGLHNDTVKAYVYNKRRSNKQEADVVEIIDRAKTEFVGVLQMNKNFGFVVPDSNKMYADIFISQSKLNGAEDGDKVVAKITDWPENSKNPFGKITQVLGKPGDHDTEIHSILLEYGLPYEFPTEVEKEASELPIEITQEEIAKRRDMRGDLTFTIDPKDAKDFDDALSIRELENGNWEIGVHIADVTHFVKPDSFIEAEAYNRATSVYLVDRVVPMLPERLSNNLCSLRPNEDKYTFSAVFEMDDQAKVVNQWYGRTVIRSDHRFSYQEAQAYIDNESDGPFKEEVLVLNRLAKILRKKRMAAGAITFDSVEVKFELDENNNPIGTYLQVSKEANHLIEEFMLLCNRKVSEFVSTKKDGSPSGKTFVYRVHEDPDPDKLLDLKLFIKQFGYELDLRNHDTVTKSMNDLLQEIQGKPEQNLIETLAIRTMSKAKYSTENDVGHYGLAFKYYSGFTSPIRRYPDMMAHRLLQNYLDGGKSPNPETWEEKCLHSSSREKLAVDAERDSIKFMQVKYMEQFIGDEFYGFITGVQEYGIFVEIPETSCEGMIRLRNIEMDSFYFDEKNYSIVGRRTGVTYQLGDKILIKVVKADLQNKQLDFELLG